MIAPTFVLYLNLWGTSAKLLGRDGLTGTPAEAESDLFQGQTLRKCQMHFAKTLLEAGREANVEVYPLGDFAYAFSSDLSKLVKLGSDLMLAMISPNGHDLIWPVRGAIARGIEQVSELPLPWIGAGLTKAAELEKSAQKGMRLLIEKFGEVPDVGYPVRTIAIRGFEHYEVNWLLKNGAADSKAEKIPDLARRLMKLETNYSQQLSSSLTGLLRWT